MDLLGRHKIIEKECKGHELKFHGFDSRSHKKTIRGNKRLEDLNTMRLTKSRTTTEIVFHHYNLASNKLIRLEKYQTNLIY